VVGRAEIAATAVSMATINAFNRINATTRQISGDWAREWVEPLALRSRDIPARWRKPGVLDVARVCGHETLRCSC
jgi:hypothetical protein